MPETAEGQDSFEGIPLAELVIEEIIWTEERASHIATRRERKGSREIGLSPEEATEAALDPSGDGSHEPTRRPRMIDAERDAIWETENAALETRAEADDSAGLVPHRRPAEGPAQVYTVRIPVDRLAELRRVAADRGIPPSVLLRSWAIERLDVERSGGPRLLSESELLATLRTVVREEMAKG